MSIGLLSKDLKEIQIPRNAYKFESTRGWVNDHFHVFVKYILWKYMNLDAASYIQGKEKAL